MNPSIFSSLKIPLYGSADGRKLVLSSYSVAIILIIISIVVAHTAHLASLPSGLYLDETSIGYNAALIAQSGVDEHGYKFPAYFKAFGEYKNPIYIYLAAFLFKLFGISEFNLRFTSTLFYLLSLLLTAQLISRVFKGKKIVFLYACVSFGFLPLFFLLSRISFEVISQLTWVSAVSLCVWNIFHENKDESSGYTKSLICGLILGTSIYTYSTARLLSFLMVISLWSIYLNKKNFKRLLLISASCCGALIPYLVFTIRNPGATTARFKTISYVDNPISVLEKISIFAKTFLSHFSLNFLVFDGDANWRHSTGHGGVIFVSTLLLFGVGICCLLIRQRVNRFHIFLFVNLLFSPVASSLTTGDTPHSLRSMLLGYYMLLLSCYGVEFLSGLKRYSTRKIVTVSIFLVLAFEIVVYQLDYFVDYPLRSVQAMESFDVKTSLQFAIDQEPEKIVFLNKPRATYANMRFYSYLVQNPSDVPLEIDSAPIDLSGTCLLYPRRYEEEIEELSPVSVEYSPSKQPNFLGKLMGRKPAEGMVKLRCYESADLKQAEKNKVG